MTADPDHYAAALEDAGIDDESLTVLVVRGATPEHVADVLGLDLTSSVDRGQLEFGGPSAYQLAEVEGGVLALEWTGYADPPSDLLARLSEGGRAAAVSRSNVQAHVRFGLARDGQVVFDDHEFTFVDDKERVPDDLRALFDAAWVDPESESEDYDEADPLTTAMAMAEASTGIRLTSDDLQRVAAATAHPGPPLGFVD